MPAALVTAALVLGHEYDGQQRLGLYIKKNMQRQGCGRDGIIDTTSERQIHVPLHNQTQVMHKLFRPSGPLYSVDVSESLSSLAAVAAMGPISPAGMFTAQSQELPGGVLRTVRIRIAVVIFAMEITYIDQMAYALCRLCQVEAMSHL
jgi:hypothetical protein